MFTVTALRHKPILQIPAAVITLGLMWFIPFLVHLIPVNSAVPLGAQLLPIFYAPLLAAWLFNPFVGLACSLLMPFINYAVTGMPEFNMAILLGLELSVFSLMLLVFKRNGTRNALVAPFSLIVGKIISALFLLIVPLMPISPWAYFSSSVINAIPGLIVLFVINLMLLRLPDER